MKKTVVAVVMLAAGAIFFLAGMSFCVQGFDKKNSYSTKNKYVGGDAYNYITNAGYFAGYLSLGGACIVSGTTLAGLGALLGCLQQKKEAKQDEPRQDTFQPYDLPEQGEPYPPQNGGEQEI